MQHTPKPPLAQRECPYCKRLGHVSWRSSNCLQYKPTPIKHKTLFRRLQEYLWIPAIICLAICLGSNQQQQQQQYRPVETKALTYENGGQVGGAHEQLPAHALALKDQPHALTADDLSRALALISTTEDGYQLLSMPLDIYIRWWIFVFLMLNFASIIILILVHLVCFSSKREVITVIQNDTHTARPLPSPAAQKFTNRTVKKDPIVVTPLHHTHDLAPLGPYDQKKKPIVTSPNVTLTSRPKQLTQSGSSKSTTPIITNVTRSEEVSEKTVWLIRKLMDTHAYKISNDEAQQIRQIVTDIAVNANRPQLIVLEQYFFVLSIYSKYTSQ